MLYPDVESIVRIISNIAGMDETMGAQRRCLMNALAKLIAADGWEWRVAVRANGDPRPSSVNHMHGGLNDSQIAGLIEQSLLPHDDQSPECEAIWREVQKGDHFTFTRRQLVDDDDWYPHPTVKRLRIERGLDDFVYSCQPCNSIAVSATVFLRVTDAEPFTERERELVHLVMSNVDWMHHAIVPQTHDCRVSEMTPRQRVVLDFLLQGYSRLEIGEALNISPHTANDHIKRIYKHFKVNSHIGLIRHFSCGDAPVSN